MAIPEPQKEIRVSDIKKALANEELTKLIRNTVPEFKDMSDEQFNKIVMSVGSRLNQFEKKFGNLTDEEIIQMGNNK